MTTFWYDTLHEEFDGGENDQRECAVAKVELKKTGCLEAERVTVEPPAQENSGATDPASISSGGVLHSQQIFY